MMNQQRENTNTQKEDNIISAKNIVTVTDDNLEALDVRS